MIHGCDGGVETGAIVNSGLGGGGTGPGMTAGARKWRWYHTISLARCQSRVPKPQSTTISRIRNVHPKRAGGIFAQI
jgi:hypothetical protein